MLNKIIFENQIDIYWDKIFKIDHELFFEVYLNGKKVGSTEFTHYEFFDLKPKTEYIISVVALIKGSNQIYQKYEDLVVTTTPLKNIIDISKSPYNAVGDGKTLNTKSIQAALDACTENDKIYIPEGIFLTGALDVHSNTEIYIAKDGVLLGSSNREDYLPKRISRFEGYELERYSALINVGKIDNSLKINCQNVVIRGEGEIRGGGLTLCNNVIDYELKELKADIDSLGEALKTFDRIEVIPGRLRPFLIDINNCENAIVTGLKVGYGSAWNIHFVYSKNVVVSRCQISSAGIWNGDGIDPDSSLNSVIYDIQFNTEDDGIAIKSGKNPEGNKINAPCKDLKIFHIRGCMGIAIGSELSGGIENVYIWDVTLSNCYRGFRVKTSKERGGYVKNVWVSNYTTPAFFVDTIYECNKDGESAGYLTKLEDFYFENVCVTGECGYIAPWGVLTLYGFSDDESHIKNITLKNFTVHACRDARTQNVKIDYVDNLIADNFKILPRK